VLGGRVPEFDPVVEVEDADRVACNVEDCRLPAEIFF